MSDWVLNLIEQGIVEADEIDPETNMRYYPDLYLYAQWREQKFHNFTEIDWLGIFNNKTLIRAGLRKNKEKVNNLTTQKRMAGGVDRELLTQQIDFLLSEQRKLERMLKPPSDDIDIALAKTVPITDFIKVNRGRFALCPFHGERTPSLKVYPTNTWYCFGCNRGGDVIDLVMEMEGIDFIEAVKKLT